MIIEGTPSTITNAHIVAVDDEPTNLQLIRRLLEREGYTHITTLSDPRDLLPVLLEREPDLILLDLHMPHLSGFAVLDLLRTWLQADAYVPIVVLTADATADARKRALGAGATDFLTKPFDAIEVLLRVRNHLQTRLLHQALRSRTQALEGQLSSILASVDEVVWSATLDGHLTYISEAASRVLGRAPETLLGNDAFGVLPVHADDASKVAGWTDQLRISDLLEREYRVVQADGAVRWLRTRCRLALGAACVPEGIHGVSADVTEHHLLAEEWARREAQEELDRAKSEMVSIVSHELRTPLVSFLGFSELLLLDDVTPDERRLWTQTIHDEAIRLTSLVEDLLDVSRIEAGQVRLNLEPCNLPEIVDNALVPFLASDDGPRLVRKYDPMTGETLADAAKMTQIVTNLVSNALKYSPNGGPVTVAIDQHRATSIRLSVTDEGLGIPPAELPRLFQRFHRVGTAEHGEIQGTGLGLYIVKQLTELHGGSIHAESAGPGCGSRFTLELPVADVLALGA